MSGPFTQFSMFARATEIAFTFILVMSVIIFDVVHGFSAKKVIDSPLLTEKISSNRTIIVDVNGEGDFKSVQSAIDSVPQGNSNWIIIHVRKGVYREKVHVRRDKPYIFMRGNGRGRTAIVWSRSSVEDSATFKVEAPHFVAFGISFKNEAINNIDNASGNQSVAAHVGADMVAFYHCAFFSTHNTLFDYKGRHYYDNCYIQGSIDFIYGRGQSLFHTGGSRYEGLLQPKVGIVMPHAQNSTPENETGQYNPKENSGFVFINGKVYGVGEVYLGRAKGAHSRVIFANTYLSRTIAPQGWTNWSYSGSTDNLYQAEYKCHGPGSASKARASWSKQLNDKEAALFLTVDFIQGKQWLPAWL